MEECKGLGIFFLFKPEKELSGTPVLLGPRVTMLSENKVFLRFRRRVEEYFKKSDPSAAMKLDFLS